MTKGMIKNIWRTITGSLGRYMAVLLITMLGVGFVTGLQLTRPVMTAVQAQYLEDTNLYDLRLISTIGFDEKDVATAAGCDRVMVAAGSISRDFVTMVGNRECVLRSQMLTPGVNDPVLKEGRMPEAANECLLDADSFGKGMIGQTISIREYNDEDTANWFSEESYVVTGLGRSSLYTSADRGTTSLGKGSLTGFIYIPEEGFDFEVYTEIYVKLDHDLMPYTDEYDSFIDEISDKMETSVSASLQEHFLQLKEDGAKAIADAEKTLAEEKADAEKTLADARIELDDAAKEIAEGETALEEGRQKLADGLITIHNMEAMLGGAYNQLAEAAATIQPGFTSLTGAYEHGLDQANQAKTAMDGLISAGQAVLDITKSQLDAAEASYNTSLENLIAFGIPENLAEFQMRTTRAILDGRWARYNASVASLEEQRAEAQTQIDESLAQLAEFKAGIDAYYTGVNAVAKGKEDYEAGVLELSEAAETLAEGKTAYHDGLTEYTEGLKELDEKVTEAEKEIADAKEELDGLKDPELFLLGRDTNQGYVSFESDANIVKDLAKLFPVFFFLIAALVCSTTMTRMIDDDRTQIGTLRALGYSRKTILMKYLIYSGSAATIGAVAGYFFFGWLFPKVIWITYGMLYKIDGFFSLYSVPLLLILWAGALLCSCGTTYLALRRTMKDMPAELIRPKAPQLGKRILLERISFIWNRLSFLRKVAMRNIFRFKKRMFMMMLGIAGCTALILTAFGIHDTIALVCDFQYNDIEKYDLSFSCDRVVSDHLLEEITKGAEDQIVTMARLMSTSGDVLEGKVTKSARMIVSADPTISTLIDLHMGSQNVAFPGKGEVLLTEKLAAMTGYAVGDTVTISVSDTEKAQLTISGIVENYVYNYIYMSAETYEEAYGKDYQPKSVYMRLSSEADDHLLGVRFANKDHVQSVNLVSEFKKSVNNMMQTLNYVVFMVLASAAALAFIVLFNLGNINISERVREIATLKVLGFRRRETGAYVFRENLVLSIMGVVPGLPLGVLLHRFVMDQIKVDMVSFKVTINPISYLLTVALVILFTIATDLILRRKIDRIHMAESLKSVE